MGKCILFVHLLVIIIKLHLFQKPSVNVIIMKDQAIISFCQALGKEIQVDICPSFGDANLGFWIKSMDNE